jgi:ATP-binding cassette, subfamily A (ABC1), member 3
MSEGRLRCAGSSLFLKKVYGVGYQLTIEKLRAIDVSHDEDAALEEEGTLTANDDRIKRIVKEAVPEASLLNNVGSELSYQLPVGAAPKFGPMFEQLDAEIDRKTVGSYGVSMTTLDEVFLLVARGESHEKREEYASASLRSGDLSKAALVEEANKSVRSRMDLENERLFLTHLGALFKKRAANFKRDKKAWVCTTILPSLFVLIGFVIFKFASPSRDLQPVTLSLDDYNVKITTGTRNPIPFNSPGEEYTCQPGICAYQQPFTQLPDLDETYFFCGYNGRLLAAPNCSISDSAFVASRFINDGASPEPASVEYVLEVRFHNRCTSRSSLRPTC